MENLRFYKKYPGFMPFLILCILVFIVVFFLIEIWSIIEPIINLLHGDWLLFYALCGGYLIGIYAFLILIVRILKKKKPNLFYVLTILLSISLFFFTIYISIINAPKPHTDSRRMADIKQLNLALEMYRDKYKDYPESLEELVSQGIMPNLPKDPYFKAPYEYRLSDDKNSFVLKTILDDKSLGALKEDVDGNKFGVDCDDPAYCVVAAP